MKDIFRKFIEAIPKTDLHVHLDGSLRLTTLVELSKQLKSLLPTYDQTSLRELVFKDSYKNLEEYLKGFSYTTAVLQNAENLERVAYELAVDNLRENVRHLEVRFAPQLHINKNLPEYKDVVGAVAKGLEKAKKEHSVSIEVISGEDIPFSYGIICCAMRYFNEHFSEYYAGLYKMLSSTPTHEMYSIASMEMARAAVELRDKYSLPVVAFDLCGCEVGYPSDNHKEAFAFAHKNFLGIDVHAGEAYGAESIYQAITKCKANRIGHGTLLFSPEEIKDTDISHPERYTDNLADYIAKRRIPIEVCLTSNLQTLPWLKNDVRNHPVKKMLDKRIPASICTDNRLVSNTTVTKELILLLENFKISSKQLRDLVIGGFKGAFFNGSYTEHREYIRKVIDRYDILAEFYYKLTLNKE